MFTIINGIVTIILMQTSFYTYIIISSKNQIVEVAVNLQFVQVPFKKLYKLVPFKWSVNS